MDNELMIKKLKKAGVKFDKGLTKQEIIKIETLCNFKFPQEIKEFLLCGLPVSEGFYNYRDFSEQNILEINNFQKRIDESFLFDIEKNNLLEEFREKFKECKNDKDLQNKLFNYLHESPKLIPFYAHRYFFSGLDNMPIVSFWQPSDSIFYGSNFENYLTNEFINKTCNVGEISTDFEKTGIWFDLIW